MKFKNRTAELDSHEHRHLAEATANVSTLGTLAKPGTKLSKQCLEASSLLADILSRGQVIDLDDKPAQVAGSTDQKKASA